MDGAGVKVDVVVTGARAHDNAQLRCGGEHGGRHLVGTHYQGVRIRYGGDELGLVFIFLEQGEFISGFADYLPDAFHRHRRERLLSGYKDFHRHTLLSKSRMHCTRASTSSWVQAL